MTAEHDLRDGSKCVVDDDGRMATISRFVDGQRVWGQVFTGSRDDYEQLVASVVADMRTTPSAFTRRDLWDENGKGGQVTASTESLRALREQRDRVCASFEEAIVVAHTEGTPITKIAAESGLSRQAIYDLLKRHGQ